MPANQTTQTTQSEKQTNQPTENAAPQVEPEYTDFPTVQVWLERYAGRPAFGMLSEMGVTAQENLIGILFRGYADDLRCCIDSGMTGHWFGLEVFAAGCDAILAIPGAGERDLDVLEVRDALVNADCMGSRPYQIPTSRWCFLADRASWLPADCHIERLETVYNDEAAGIRDALEALKPVPGAAEGAGAR